MSSGSQARTFVRWIGFSGKCQSGSDRWESQLAEGADNQAAKPHPHFQRVEQSPRRPFHLVFLFVHKKRIALTVPTIVIIGTTLLTAGVLCLTFVGSMRAQQSPAERVAEIQAALRFLNAE
jgi:hypothetical protein